MPVHLTIALAFAAAPSATQPLAPAKQLAQPVPGTKELNQRRFAQLDRPSQTPSAAAQPATQAPSQDELNRADTDAADWFFYNKSYLGYRFSALAQINASNVSGLVQICSFKLGEKGSFQNGPIVYNGVVYATTALATYAIDGATCTGRWRHEYQPGHVFQRNNKGAAIAGGRIVRGTPDGHLIALDAASGELLWDRQIMDATAGEFATAAPLVWHDLIFIGKAGAERGIRGEMMAFSAANGEKVWSFQTIPSPGAVGSETWQKLESIEHGGGSTWTSYSLDPVSGLLIVPVGNPGPDFANEVRPGTNLFTDSVVALDAGSGQLKWWHQLLAPDDRDWDTSVVAAFDTADGSKLVAAAGKDGMLHVVDRTSGGLKFKAPLVSRYVNTTAAIPGGAGIRLCPIAAVQWNGPAYSPDTNLIYMNGIDWCARAIKGPTPVYQRGEEYLGWANSYGTRDPIQQAFGWVNAIDPRTGQTEWRYRTPSPPLGGITATAGGLVMTGETSGDFIVLNAATGALLFRGNVGGAIGGGVITYEVGGKQRIAIAAGDNNPAYETSGENMIVVLGLP